jgi:hypothetical protein
MASMCFGLLDASDNRFGLSEAQQNAGVNPAEWGIRTPGKAVLDAPTIPESRIAMPFRTYHWGENADIMAAHAAAYPITARPVDPITARIVGGPVAGTVKAAPAPARPSVTLVTGNGGQADNPGPEDDGPGDPVGEYLTIDDPGPEISADITGPDAEIEAEPGDAEFEFADAPEKMTPDQARAAFATQLAEWTAQGRETFAPRDLYPLMEQTGMSRAWIQARIKNACEADNPVIERDDSAGVYRLLTPAGQR